MDKLEFCPLCASKKLVFKGEAKDYLVSNQMFGLMECKVCGFVFTNPRPVLDKLGGYYKSADYISHADKPKDFVARVYVAVRNYMFRQKSAMLRSLKGGGDDVFVLDYGCATGEFLAFLNKKGFRVAGFEPDAEARQLAVDKGLDVRDEKKLMNGALHGKVDLITLWHVFEHIPDFHEKIHLFDALLKKDGVIVVAVPEYKSFDARFYGLDWAAWDVPRHLNHFEEKTIRMLFEENGFKYMGKKPLIFDSFYVSMLTEKVKGNGFLGVVRGLGIGLISLMYGLLRKHPFSSQIYIFKKS